MLIYEPLAGTLDVALNRTQCEWYRVARRLMSGVMLLARHGIYQGIWIASAQFIFQGTTSFVPPPAR